MPSISAQPPQLCAHAPHTHVAALKRSAPAAQRRLTISRWPSPHTERCPNPCLRPGQHPASTAPPIPPQLSPVPMRVSHTILAFSTGASSGCISSSEHSVRYCMPGGALRSLSTPCSNSTRHRRSAPAGNGAHKRLIHQLVQNGCAVQALPGPRSPTHSQLRHPRATAHERQPGTRAVGYPLSHGTSGPSGPYAQGCCTVTCPNALASHRWHY